MRWALAAAGSLVLYGCGPDSSAGDEGAASTSDASFVFDQAQLRTYELELEPEAWAQLNEDPRAEIYVPAQLQFEGHSWGPIGLRYKGAYGSLYWCFDELGEQICPKLSMKLDFNEYGEGPLFYGLEQLNLHAMASAPLPGRSGGDGSKLHERLAYNLFRDNGVIAPRAVHARVLINGTLIGLFVAVEQIDARFAAQHFPDAGAGNVYKEVWPLHLSAEPYLAALKDSPDASPSAANMVAFAGALDAAGDAGFVATLDEWMEVDALMRLIAVDRAIGNWDGIFGVYDLPAGNHNYYWYEQRAEPRMWLIPWDLDHSFEHPNWLVEDYGAPRWTQPPGDCEATPIFFGITRYPAMCDDFLRRLITYHQAEWRAAGQEFLDTLYSQDAMDERIDFYADQIDAAVREDPDLDHAQWRAQVEALRGDLPGLRARFQADIDG